MQLDRISFRDKASKEFNTLIEYPQGRCPVQYEFHQDSVAITDEVGTDDGIIAIPLGKLKPYHGEIRRRADLPLLFFSPAAQVVSPYKDPGKNQWGNWLALGDACRAALQSANDGIEEIKRLNEVQKTNLNFIQSGSGLQQKDKLAADKIAAAGNRKMKQISSRRKKEKKRA